MPTTGKFIGDNLQVLIGTTPIGKATSLTLSLSQQTAEASDMDSSGHSEYLPSFRDGTIDFEGYVDYAADNDVDTLANLMLSGTYADRTFTVVFGTQVSGDTTYSYSAILTSLDYEGSAGETVTMSGTFQLTGAPTIGTAVIS